jgi:hypothetical protein
VSRPVYFAEAVPDADTKNDGFRVVMKTGEEEFHFALPMATARMFSARIQHAIHTYDHRKAQIIPFRAEGPAAEKPRRSRRSD